MVEATVAECRHPGYRRAMSACRKLKMKKLHSLERPEERKKNREVVNEESKIRDL